jgi:hypothetical protein
LQKSCGISPWRRLRAVSVSNLGFPILGFRRFSTEEIVAHRSRRRRRRRRRNGGNKMKKTEGKKLNFFLDFF